MNAASARLAVRARADGERRCAICHGDASASIAACVACATLFHEDCRASHGRCPSLGCTGRRTPPRLRLERAAPGTFPEARARDVLFLWPRLIARTIFGTVLALALLPMSIASLLSGAIGIVTGQVVLGAFALLLGAGLGFLAARASGVVNRERRFQNRVRELLARERPLVLEGRRSTGDERFELRAAPGDLAMAVVDATVLRRLPRWIRAGPLVATCYVRGLAVESVTLGSGPLVIQDEAGRTWFVPEDRVTRLR